MTNLLKDLNKFFNYGGNRFGNIKEVKDIVFSYAANHGIEIANPFEKNTFEEILENKNIVFGNIRLSFKVVNSDMYNYIKNAKDERIEEISSNEMLEITKIEII